ncbi:competence-damaged family protein [Acinetobacter baumannii 44362_3]|nr:competence-damaged family protein [Acinetobacter baumannii 44362_3]
MFNKCCELLAKEKIKIAFFESASAGYLAYRFSLSPYSGDILIGSLVSYDLRVKENTLHISEELIEKYTAESMQVTVEMINKGKELLHADLYVACTGLLKKEPAMSEFEGKSGKWAWEIQKEQQAKVEELQKRLDGALKETQYALQYVEEDMRGNHEFLQMAMIRTLKAIEQVLKGGA